MPAQTTLRAQLRRLAEIGAVEKHRRNRFPGVLEYELTAPGRDLLLVAIVLERWLAQAPQGPLTLGANVAKAAIKALADGWSATMLRALAAGPLALTELDGLIASLSYPTLERRLSAMRVAGQVERRPNNGRGTPYAVTEWLRQGVAPLTAASHWERKYLAAQTTPISRIDVEAAFLLALPLLRPPQSVSGVCRLTVETLSEKRRSAGVVVAIEGGALESCSTRPAGDVDAWASGPPTAWLGAVMEQNGEPIELGGNRKLACAVLDGLRAALFGAPAEKALHLDVSDSIREHRSN